jgi:exopolyphosphatase/guanosine-5'-triphosphate,3'-diphosphate pyrophosphatase
MSVIVPRWEWRTFGSRFGAADAAFDALPGGDVQESDELYVLSAAPLNVKIRDDLLDVKELRAENDDGLQQWIPVRKVALPVPAAEVSRLLKDLDLPVEGLEDRSYGVDDLVRVLGSDGDRVRVLPVHKRRVRYSVNGCTAERTDVVADGRATRTIAIESSDPDAVVDAVRSVHLGGYLNTDYRGGLAALVAGMPERYAVIDVGTNSVKFHIGERAPDGAWSRDVDRAELTRLGEGLGESGTIQPDPLERTTHAIAVMADEARALDARAIVAVGTAGLRMAANRATVVASIRDRTGVSIDVISGEEESRLAYVAAVAGLGLVERSLVVFDTGGGSSQFTFGRGMVVDERFSLDVGAVRYTERFGLQGRVTPQALDDTRTAIAADLSRLDRRPAPDALVGLGGAITNMTAVMLGMAAYDPEAVQGAVLDAREVDRQIELYRSSEPDVRQRIVGLQPKRAEVILAGACIVRTVMDKLRIGELTVSDRGVRHGVLVERFGDQGGELR